MEQQYFDHFYLTESDSLGRKEKIDKSLSFQRALRRGSVCLHPTDTIWGLTCDPKDMKSVDKLIKIKSRSTKKSFIGLVCDLNRALPFWEKLPPFWLKVLSDLWPCPLTIVWKAAKFAPKILVSSEGYIAMRSPNFPSVHQWFYEVLKTYSYPLISTSVNISGDNALLDSASLKDFCFKNDIWYPDDIFHKKENDLPSTVIQIFDDNTFKVLRSGAYPIDKILSHL